MNNQATIPITTANINISLTLPSTITTTAISSASDRATINLSPAISVAATGQDANFETRLNAMENAIFKLGSTLEKFILTNNRSQGESDRGYLTDSAVNASQSEMDQSSDEDSNCGPPPQKKPSGNTVNVDICRASKNVFDRDINLLVPDVEKQDQSGKVSKAPNDLAIFEKINTGKMSDEELGPAISSQITEVAMKYWSE